MTTTTKTINTVEQRRSDEITDKLRLLAQYRSASDREILEAMARLRDPGTWLDAFVTVPLAVLRSAAAGDHDGKLCASAQEGARRMAAVALRRYAGAEADGAEGMSNPELRSRLLAVADALEPDALRIVTLVAERLAAGRRYYGALDLERDERDFAKEALEEAADGLAYAAAALLRGDAQNRHESDERHPERADLPTEAPTLSGADAEAT